MATITVRGTGSVATEPDEATVAIEVSAVGATAAEAYADVAARSARLVALFDRLAIAPTARTTTGVSVAEHVEWVREDEQRRAFRASNSVSVRLDDPQLVASLLAQAVEETEARVSGPMWTVRLDNPARLEACTVAAANARAKAQAYAEALGCALGPIVEIVEPGAPSSRTVHAFAAIDAAAAVEVSPGQQAVSANVAVTYELA